MNVTYTTVGNYQIPDLVMDAQPDGTLGKCGRVRKRYLEQKHNGTFTALVLSGKLTEHLLDVDRTAREQLESTVRQMAAVEGVTERLKAADQMEWLRRQKKHPRPRGGNRDPGSGLRRITDINSI